MVKVHLYNSRHPIDAYPFETFYDGSWWGVESIKFENGSTTAVIDYLNFKIENNVSLVNLRMKSRKANISDCTCFLRPGIDVCAFATIPSEESLSEESQQPVWNNAKLISIERNPHLPQCTCCFHVSIDGVNHNLGIDNIAILQKLEKKPSEDVYYRWSYSKDCCAKAEVKWFRLFKYDISWFIVASSLKGVSFEVRSIQGKMVYLILDGDVDTHSLGYNKTTILKGVNFRRDDEVLRPNIQHFVLEVPVEDVNIDAVIDVDDDQLCSLLSDDAMYLRRSKRQNTQPDFFVSEPFTKFHEIRKGKGGIKRRKYVGTLSTNISCDSDNDCVILEEPQLIRELRAKQRKVSTSDQLAEDHTSKNMKIDDGCLIDCSILEESQLNQLRANRRKISSIPREDDDTGENTVTVPISYCRIRPRTKIVLDSLNKTGKVKHDVKSSANDTMQRMNKNGRKPNEVLHGKVLHRKDSNKNYSYWNYSGESYGGRRTYEKKSLSVRQYKEIIERCMKNIESKIEKYQDPLVVSPLKPIRHPLSVKRPINDPVVDKEEEDPELQNLWNIMEVLINTEKSINGSQTNNVGQLSSDRVRKSRKVDEELCPHDYKLDEEVGLKCQLCGSVSTEIRYISPPFVKRKVNIRNGEYWDEINPRNADDTDFDLYNRPRRSKELSFIERSDSVWSLIPQFKSKFHIHQKNAFEFLWRSLAGSLIPENMLASAEIRNGCVISHSPGAGKTMLVISFLVSYLKIFPEKRPLILAPKTTLYTWCKEFKKWEVSVPVYQIHARQHFTKELRHQKPKKAPGDLNLNKDAMHVVDCLEKLESWHDHPSVLLMSYPAFITFMRENTKFKHWRYMSRVLQQSSGLLILDEGHNPRSTGSRLRKLLMKVKTEQRILLSGTLFQNNFEEYFNTLCLARPRFITEVIRRLTRNVDRDRYVYGNSRQSREKLARRIFVEKIAMKIHSKVEEVRQRGLNMLREISNDFIDVYESGKSDTLLGLQTYKILMKPTEMQQGMLAKLRSFISSAVRYPIELQIAVSLLLVHPWLIKSLAYAIQYFSLDEFEALDKYKLDVNKGSKVRFIVNLVYRCVIKREKVLIFARYIATMKLFVEIFEKIFGWQNGVDVLILHGKQELFERARVIDKFDEKGGAAHVLIASIAACGEGISLIAASRVVLLDSEWNPSKTKQAVARAFRPGQEKIVYVYELLGTGTLEEEKYGKNTWKERVSRMISVGAEDSSCRRTDNIEDEVLKDIVDEDRGQSYHMVLKDEKISNDDLIAGNELAVTN